MTLDEKLAISNKACALWHSGDKEGFHRVIKTAPMPPYLAKIAKEKKVSIFLLTAAGIYQKQRRNLALTGLPNEPLISLRFRHLMRKSRERPL
jgi:hypothetical protein